MLTRTEIEKLPAGLELNALLAEVLLGCEKRMYVRQSADKPWVPAFRPSQHVGREKQMMYGQFGNQPLVSQDGGVWGAVAFAPPFSTKLEYAWPLFAGNGWILFENKWNDANPWFIFPDERALADWRPLSCAPTVELAICYAKLTAHFEATTPTTEKEAELC